MNKNLLVLCFASCIIFSGGVRSQHTQLSESFDFGQNGLLNGKISHITSFGINRVAAVGDFNSFGFPGNSIPHLLLTDMDGKISENFTSPFSNQGPDFAQRFENFGYNRYFNHYFTLTKNTFPSPYNNKLIVGFNNQGALIGQLNLPTPASAGLQANSELRCATPDKTGNIWVAFFQPSNQGCYLGRLLSSNGQWDSAFPPQLVCTGCKPFDIWELSNSRFCLVTQRTSVQDSAALFVLNSTDLQFSAPAFCRFPVVFHGYDNSGRTYFSTSTQNTKIFRLSLSNKIEPNYEITIPTTEFFGAAVTGDGVMAVSTVREGSTSGFEIKLYNTAGFINQDQYPSVPTGIKYNISAASTDKRSIFFASDDIVGINDQNPAILKLDIDTVVSVNGKITPKVLNFFPNPATDQVQLINAPENAKVNIFTSSGRIVTTEILSKNKSIQIGHLPQGLYLIRIEAGSNIYAGKLIVGR
jgi:hypothetical protein